MTPSIQVETMPDGFLLTMRRMYENHHYLKCRVSLLFLCFKLPIEAARAPLPFFSLSYQFEATRTRARRAF
jgi:hypothetical protein